MKEMFNEKVLSFLTDGINDTIYPLGDYESAKKYLLFINKTLWNNLSTIDIIDYERLIYIELTFPEDEEIQNLVQILKENICKNYKFKWKYINRLIDPIPNDYVDEINKTRGFLMEELTGKCSL